MDQKADCRGSQKADTEQSLKKKRLFEQINQLKKLKQARITMSINQNKSQSIDPKKLIEYTMKQRLVQNRVQSDKSVLKQQIVINRNQNQVCVKSTQSNTKHQQESHSNLDVKNIGESRNHSQESSGISTQGKRTLGIVYASTSGQKSRQTERQLSRMQGNSKKIKRSINDKQRQNTYIEIGSSSQQEQKVLEGAVTTSNLNSVVNQGQSSLQLSNNKPQFQDRQPQFQDKQTNFHSSRIQVYLNSMFSSSKITYLKVSKQDIARFYKERSRLNQVKTSFTHQQCRVHLAQNYVSLARTINTQFIVDKIAKKTWISEQINLYKFWLFKGSTKSFQELVIQMVRNNQNYIQSKNLVNLQELSQWFTLAHLFSFSTNLLFVVERIQPKPLIKNCYPTKCIHCKIGYVQTCLCLRYFSCRKKACCQQAILKFESHQIMCRYSSPLRKSLLKSQFAPHSKRGVVGLANSQNSCFMNTALQCLAACEPLTQYFLQKEYVKNINYGNHMGTFGQIATRYAQLLKEMFVTQEDVLNLNKFKASVGRWDNKYLDDQQQDSQQFLLRLLDWLKQDLNLNLNSPSTSPQHEDETESDVERKSKVAWESHLSRNNSIIQYLMAGQLKSSIQCVQCLYESSNFQTFLTLPLPLDISPQRHNSKQSFKIKVCLVHHNFTKRNQSSTVTLENYWYEDAVAAVKRQFDLSQHSCLIGLVLQCQAKTLRIQDSAQGSKQIRHAKDKPNQTQLLFLEYKAQDLNQNNIEIQFVVKVRQSRKQVGICCPRYLFISRQQQLSTTPYNVFQRLLKYFYKVMFKKSQKITQEQYLRFYLTQENKPFRVYLNFQRTRLEILVHDQLCLNSKCEISVVFQNDDTFDCRQLVKAVQLVKQTKNKEITTQSEQGSSMTTKMCIYQCLKQFQRTDTMEYQNSWHCPSCNQKRKAFKKITIFSCPKILILFFKRFASTSTFQDGQHLHTTKKIQTFVEFPHILDLNSYVYNKQSPYTFCKVQPKYRLFAVANHYNLSSRQCPQKEIGHYTAFVNHQNNWYKINDDKIYPVGQGDVCTKNAYILFYSQLER